VTNAETWVTYGNTESGDDLKVVVWRHEPTKEEVNAVYREIHPEEYEEVGFVNWKLDKPSYHD
jgi:hypothetical protein